MVATQKAALKEFVIDILLVLPKFLQNHHVFYANQS